MAYIIKDSNGKYYSYDEDESKVYWIYKQSDAKKFKRKELAEQTSAKLNKQLSESRVVKLKSCQEQKEEKQLIVPKEGTVFLDLTMPSPTSNIVTCVYEDCDDYIDSTEYVCSTNAISPKEDTWGTLEEYNEYLAKGKIKILWEPK